MNRLVALAALAAAVLLIAPDGAGADPRYPAQSAGERGPFPRLMNSIFGDRQARGAHAMPDPRFAQPQRAHPQPRFARPHQARPQPRVVSRAQMPHRAQPHQRGHYGAHARAVQPPAAQHSTAPRRMDPRFERTVVPYAGSERPGTIIVNTSERFLYLVQDGGTARRYGVGVGREGFSWRGTEKVTRKAEWPSWRPPESMKRRQPGLPDYMAGGPDNPLGARALYLGSTLYRIHGSNEPWTIGTAVSSGCIRMTNDDVIDLYNRVRVGATVKVI